MFLNLKLKQLMEVNIIKYKYEKIELSNEVANLPDEPIYFFIYGTRISVAVIPKWTTWNIEEYDKPEEIYFYNFITIDGTEEVKLHGFPVNEISNLYQVAKKSTTNSYFHEVIEYLVDGIDSRQIRDKERFVSEYNNIKLKYDNILELK